MLDVIFRLWLACILFVAHFDSSVIAETIHGQVVGVTDGDTLTVLINKQQVKIRLAEIDAPEMRQDYGQRAKQALSTLVFKKAVVVEVNSRDKYGRTLARIYADGLDVNAEMVRLGYAWVYRKYARDPHLLIAETEARASHRGLWAGKTALPPWEWRTR